MSRFATVNNIPKSCVACNGLLVPFGIREEYSYARCQICGTIQLSPFPTKEELDRAYAEDYATSGHYGIDPEIIFHAASPFYKAVLSELYVNFLPYGTILDYGCGWGGMCRLLRDNEFDYLGIDFESDSLNYCKNNGLNVSADTLDSLLLAEKKFSAILLITVFEHLHDHVQVLHKIRNILMPGGLIIILIPTAQLYGWLARTLCLLRVSPELPALNTTFCPPWHTAIFSVNGANRLITSCGYELVRILPAPSGKGRGLMRVIQGVATVVAQNGYALFGSNWPLVLNHILVYRSP